MIPHIFVSSSIEDLLHIRDALRDTLLEVGYKPIMSEFGDIGYSPWNSAEDSCYTKIKECQIVLLVIGKRYNSDTSDKQSITHKEYLVARELGIPVLTFIYEEVLQFLKIYEANLGAAKTLSFPGMNEPKMTFEFIRDIKNSEINNGIYPFNSVRDVKNRLIVQVAHIFGDLLNREISVKIRSREKNDNYPERTRNKNDY